MPPKCKYTRAEIVRTAFEIVREKGENALTARDLGARLGTSTRPIFTAFENMEELKKEVMNKSAELFLDYSGNFTEYTPAFKQMGMQIVSFATNEPYIFKLLFMNKASDSLLEQTADQCVQIIARDTGLSLGDAKMVFDQVWIFTFGLATFSAMKVYQFTEEEISDMLTREFSGTVMMIKSDLAKIHTAKPTKKE